MYVTDIEYQAYASQYGVTLPPTESERQLQLSKASLYIDSLESWLKGDRTERDQLYAYPRTGLVIYGAEYDDDEIPGIVKKAQMELALEVNLGVNLYEFSANLPVVRERVEGAVDVSYAAPSRVEQKGRDSVAMRIVKDLMVSCAPNIRLMRS